MTLKKKLLIVGGYGSGEIAMSTFEAANSVSNEWDIAGYLSDVVNPGEFLGRHKVVGSTDELSDWVNKGYYIHYTLHFNAKKKEERVLKLESLSIPLEAHASAAHPLSFINPETKIGYGTLFLPFAASSVGSVLGNFCHVYTSGFLGHDCITEEYCTIAAHSILGGRVKLKKGAHLGLNASAREDIIIGEYSIIGMGSVVISNVERKSIYAGNPAKKIRSVL